MTTEQRVGKGGMALAPISSMLWTPANRIVLATSLGLALLVLAHAERIANAWMYLFLHMAATVALAALARSASRWVRVVFDWSPLFLMVAMYFELAVVIPAVNPFPDFHYDHMLQAIDQRLLSDPAALVANLGRRPLSDLLMACYLAYYPFTLALPVLLYINNDMRRFSLCVSVLLSALSLCFIGYILVPAVGPHRLFDLERAAALYGYGLAEHGYQVMLRVPHEPPDAFPSGHALMGVLVPALAFRLARRWFAWLLPIGVGIVVSTGYLRFHYLADVVAAFAIAPIAWWLGVKNERWDLAASRAVHLLNTEQVSPRLRTLVAPKRSADGSPD